MSKKLIFLALICFAFTGIAAAQSSSRGPGKGPPAPGMGSKYTYPQPGKVVAVSPEAINPATQIPEHPEKFIWKLSNKRFATGSNPNDVPVYGFAELFGGRSLVGQAKVGEEITLDEVRVAGRRNHYKFKWSGAARDAKKFGINPEFWIDGINIEYGGKK
jgi:hypothetical protein